MAIPFSRFLIPFGANQVYSRNSKVVNWVEKVEEVIVFICFGKTGLFRQFPTAQIAVIGMPVDGGETLLQTEIDSCQRRYYAQTLPSIATVGLNAQFTVLPVDIDRHAPTGNLIITEQRNGFSRLAVRDPCDEKALRHLGWIRLRDDKGRLTLWPDVGLSC